MPVFQQQHQNPQRHQQLQKVAHQLDQILGFRMSTKSCLIYKIIVMITMVIVIDYRMGFISYLPNGPVNPYQLDESIFNIMGIWCTF